MHDVYAGVPGSERYAGFWIRTAANVLDGLMLAALNQALRLATGVWQVFGVALILPFLVTVGCWVALGATPGKMMCRLRIVDEPTGGRPSAWQCIGRYFMALVSMACVGLGYLWIVIDPRRQGWHDKIVRTLVIREARTP